MNINFAVPASIKAGSWVIGAVEGGVLLPAALSADKASGGALTRALKFARFKGAPGQMVEVLAPAGVAASRLLLVGLGKPEALDEKGLETIGAQIAARLLGAGESTATLQIDVLQSRLRTHLEQSGSCSARASTLVHPACEQSA